MSPQPVPGRSLDGEMRTRLLLVCLALTCVLLVLGLWPFHAPVNDAAWLDDRNGLSFHGAGTAYSPSTLSLHGSQFSVELWAKPAFGNTWGTLLALRDEASGNPFQFTLSQSSRDLLFRSVTRVNRFWTDRNDIFVDDALSPRKAVFISLTQGKQGTRVYLDGDLVRTVPDFPALGDSFHGRVILGDSTGQSDGWTGEIRGLAIYDSELTEAQVRRHSTAWVESGRPQTAQEERNIALYLFDQRAGHVISSNGGPAPSLEMPETYEVLHKQRMESLWEEFSPTPGYWADVRNNIVGFIPFGFLCYAYFMGAARSGEAKPRRSMLLVCLLGFAVSLSIESLQILLPTRESGTTDLCTNTLGTWLGVRSYQRWGQRIGKLLPQWLLRLPPAVDG